MRDLRDFFVEPLFSDALGGEFTPHSDKSNIQTLGRLAVDTYAYGNEIDAEPGFSRYLYTPPWSRRVESEINCRLNARYSFLKSLQLRDSSGVRLDVISGSDTDGVPNLSLFIDGQHVLLSEQTPAYSAAARNTITRHAQAFFNRIKET